MQPEAERSRRSSNRPMRDLDRAARAQGKFSRRYSIRGFFGLWQVRRAASRSPWAGERRLSLYPEWAAQWFRATLVGIDRRRCQTGLCRIQLHTTRGFPGDKPSRSTLQATNRVGAKIEIGTIACKPRVLQGQYRIAGQTHGRGRFRPTLPKWRMMACTSLKDRCDVLYRTRE